MESVLQQGKLHTAEEYFGQAADAGHPGAMFCLAAVKARHVDSDFEASGDSTSAHTAELLFFKAANRGDPHAQHWVAERLLQSGDVEMALRYYHAAARQEHGESIVRLAELAENGTAGAMLM